MSDLLVKLYGLPDAAPFLGRVEEAGYTIRRALAPDRAEIRRWVAEHFNKRWASEVEMAYSGHPVRCFLARDHQGGIAGFACHDATFRGFFGPTGVAEEHRGRGLGTALLLRSLHAMAEAGYAYAVIGASSADAYYAQTVGATPIPDSDPGPYRR